jgi:hypothetical protein
MKIRLPTNFWRGSASYASGFAQATHVALRAELMVEAYRRRREAYDAEARRRGVRYEPEAVAEQTRRRLDSKGLAVREKPRGQVRTLSYVPLMSWHPQLIAHLRELGPLHNFNYRDHGLEFRALAARDPATVTIRRRACEAFERYATEVTSQEPVDWVFVYANGLEILGDTLRRVGEITRAPVVSMCLDDKQSWESDEFGGQRGGQIDIARHFDLAWTSARIACEWYLVEGSNPVFMGEGCSPDLYRPGRCEQDIDVCFVGQAYGYRPRFVHALARTGVHVAAFGHGWPKGPIGDDDLIRVFQRSKIILGLGGIGWSEQLKNVKGRDFDSPCVGAYLTSYNPDLAEFFAIGEEVACYSTPDEAVELIRQLLADDEARTRLAHAGRRRCVAQHTWGHRFQEVLRLLGSHGP